MMSEKQWKVIWYFWDQNTLQIFFLIFFNWYVIMIKFVHVLFSCLLTKFFSPHYRKNNGTLILRKNEHLLILLFDLALLLATHSPVCKNLILISAKMLPHQLSCYSKIYTDPLRSLHCTVCERRTCRGS